MLPNKMKSCTKKLHPHCLKMDTEQSEENTPISKLYKL